MSTVVVETCGGSVSVSQKDNVIPLPTRNASVGGSTAYEKSIAQGLDPLTTSESEYYAQLAAIMQGTLATASNGNKKVGDDIQSTLGDGSRQLLTA